MQEPGRLHQERHHLRQEAVQHPHNNQSADRRPDDVTLLQVEVNDHCRFPCSSSQGGAEGGAVGGAVGGAEELKLRQIITVISTSALDGDRYFQTVDCL